MSLGKLLVLGGTGFVGRAFIHRVVDAQGAADIVVPTRRESNAQPIRHLPGVVPMSADVHDGSTLARLLDEVDAVVNLVAILHGSQADFQRVHVDLPRRLVQAMAGAGVKRLVHVSALGVAADAPSDYLRSKAAGETVLHEAARRDGLAVTIFRPSVIFGEHDRLTNLFARLQRLAPVLPLAGADSRYQPVWVEDVAEAMLRGLRDPATAGHTYECAGPEVMTLADLVHQAGRAAGHERRVLPLPAWAATLQAGVLEAMPGPTLMSRDNLKSMRVPNVATGRLPGLESLGIAPGALQSLAPEWLAPGRGAARMDRWRSMRG